MIEFLSIDRKSNSNEYDKGILFEELVRKLVKACGYRDINLRRKQNSLEYDVTAIANLGNKKLVGEAKAIQKKVSDELFKFVAKMLLDWNRDSSTLGFFVSTSELTAETLDYMNQIKENYNLQVLSGEEAILNKLAETANYLNLEQIATLSIQSHGGSAGECIFLVTDRGEFFIQLICQDGMTTADSYCVFDVRGKEVKDNDFIALLGKSLPNLKGLLPVKTNKTHDNVEQVVQERKFEQEFMNLIQGKGWFDYKLPASPDYFIGRETIIEKVNVHLKQILNGETAVRFFEILSRSGVGKSSTSLKIASMMNEQGNISIVVDSRAIESPLQLLSVFKVFIDKVSEKYNLEKSYPSTLREIPIFISKYSKILESHNSLGVIIFDQLESLFNRSEAYTATVDILFDILHTTNNVVFGLARKSDQYTTYDESSKIDLNRITSYSVSFQLKDFNLEEATQLIEKIRVETKGNVSKDLRQFILDFSSDGFPWLLKRICSHIVSLIREGKTQQFIIESSFQLEDLFSEELDSLDELTKDFLLRAIYYMPATADELSEIFTKEERLNDYLSILQHQRLIRLTGRTYDTYNDVLKEYLKTGRISVSLKYVPRQFPNAIMKLFEAIVEKKLQTIESVATELKQRESIIFNKVRELKQLGLISMNKGTIKVNESAIRAYKQGTLDALVQSCMKQNGLIRQILKLLSEKGQINNKELIVLLQDAMSFTTASDETWSNYSNITISWLKNFGLAHAKNGVLTQSPNHEVIVKENISNDYLPSSYLQHIIKLVSTLNVTGEASAKKISGILNRKQVSAVIQDAMFLGFVEPSSNGYKLSNLGKFYISSDDVERKSILSKNISTFEFASNIVNKLKYEQLDFDNAFESVFNTKSWTESTTQWRKKLISNWLTHSGLIPGKRKGRKLM